MALAFSILLVLGASPNAASAWALDDARAYTAALKLPRLSQDFFARCARSKLTALAPGGPPALAQQTMERQVEIGRVIGGDCFREYHRQTVSRDRWTPEAAALYEFVCARLPDGERERCNCRWKGASRLFPGPASYEDAMSTWHAANDRPVSTRDRSRLYALADACLRPEWTPRDRDALVAKFSEKLAGSSHSGALRVMGTEKVIECVVERYTAAVPGGPREEEKIGSRRIQETWNEAADHCGRALAEQVASSDEWTRQAVEAFTFKCVSSHGNAAKALCECLGGCRFPRSFTARSSRHLTVPDVSASRFGHCGGRS